MNILQPALSALFFLLAVFCLGGMLLPDRAVHEQHIHLPQDPMAVFARLDGFAAFDAVSPWAGNVPSLRFERSGGGAGDDPPRLRWTTAGGDAWEATVAARSVPDSLRIDIGPAGSTARGRSMRLLLHLQPRDGGTVLSARIEGDHHGALLARWQGMLSPALQVAAGDLALGLRRLRVLLQRAAQAR